MRPRYKHDAAKLSLRTRGIDLSLSDVMMSDICKSADLHFVGISIYSPRYKAKAERLLRSCARVGICCKVRQPRSQTQQFDTATLRNCNRTHLSPPHRPTPAAQATELPGTAFGPDAPEGSEAFRFETIASKPSFILDQLDATLLPVVFLDVDLEFHSFPQLFVPGGWPNGPRDVAIFNYWGNESDWKHASTPTTGSGVVFFNQTQRARAVLTAWAEAMAWPANQRAPDDQVFDTILKKGGWLARASFGWLPASYLRTMPAYYRGVVPVLDHDHGSAPGLLKHSTATPQLPEVDHMELADEGHGAADHVHEAAPIPRAADDNEEWRPSAAAPQQQQEDKDEDEEDVMLPKGTCTAKSPDLGGDSAAQGKWDSWCDVNCVVSKWGGLGGKGGCRDGSETGSVGCVCTQGVAPVSVKTGRPLGAAAADQ
eukprot:scaffold21976_cov56-Phaeocystis_antarctica.AAC.1